MHQHATDSDLIAGYQSGDESCLLRLIRRYEARLFTAILIQVRDKPLAEDIFQETFCKIINTLRAGQYKEEGKFLPWAVRIAHNLAIDHYRREARMPKVRDNGDFSILSVLKLPEDNMEEQLEKRQVREQVRRLIDLLPAEQKQVLVMRHFGEMSFKEIAAATGVSINTALGRMRYALINLRKLIRDKRLVLE
jgi:RNA polymerase sigma-70 factor (ECF subfamily)